MIPRAFEYHAPKTIPDALGLLKQFGDEAKLLAGGHSLLPMMKLRFAQPGQDGCKPNSRTALGNSGGGRKLHQSRLRYGR